ncbi:hypothetical protein [Paraclostridium dentum]|uniref:hypothetical protein n=1 Tax=Paraclostridium dentum TaxID=2662455 RepID=UPI003B00919E
MTEGSNAKLIEKIIVEKDLKLCLKDENNYIEIPKDIIHNDEMDICDINDFIRISQNIEKLKDNIIKLLFEKESYVSIHSIGTLLLNIKSEEKIEDFQKYIDIDINSLEEKFKSLSAYFDISIDDIYELKEAAKLDYINNSQNENEVLDKSYVDNILYKVKNSRMYSLIKRSRYGSISKEYNTLDLSGITDLNDEEIGGEYSPILVIYKPAKYIRGEYILDDLNYVYIKRQPLNALINQEKLNEKGRDGMGAITYIKLNHDLTNENLQEILSELYVDGQKNNMSFENIRLADINCNKLWLTADRLKKEFKELRYYNKNLTQKIKDIYDSTGAYYTQISGKYIFNTREFLNCYKTYKNKDIALNKK